MAYNKHGIIYQILIIMLLCAVITGSFLTGKSVRESLKAASCEKLGNTGVVISSGTRYFSHSLTERIRTSIGSPCTGLIELNGYCSKFGENHLASGVKIIGADSGFFEFHGIKNLQINRGEVHVNRKLADMLSLVTGDEVIVKYRNVSQIPSDAPFAPGQGEGVSSVLKVGRILEADEIGNFSLDITQMSPLNVFLNISDIADASGNLPGYNRLLTSTDSRIPENELALILKETLSPEDIGLVIRESVKGGYIEIISKRIFIDQNLLTNIKEVFPSASPVITYLGNVFRKGDAMTPYSFISGMPDSLYNGIPDSTGIIINEWMASDLAAEEGDTIEVTWYSPDISRRLDESSAKFIVKGITDFDSNLSDPSLMPEFAGISGRESCSDWDAGVPVDLSIIRPKDEIYWNLYKGTPKAFINYHRAKELWANNYGPATSVRLPGSLSVDLIREKLTGSLDPFQTGFSIIDIAGESERAASEGTDFSTLFLGLGFFIIMSSVILLILVISVFLDSRKEHIRTLSALGFSDRRIKKILFFESAFIALTGSAAGIFAGLLFNNLIIKALNTVWRDTVQTDTLISYTAPGPMIAGFLVTNLIAFSILYIKTGLFLKNIGKAKTGHTGIPSHHINFKLFIITSVLSAALILMSYYVKGQEMILSFTGGVFMLISIVILSAYFNIRRPVLAGDKLPRPDILSRFYYSFFPSNAILPVVFVAAGIFAIMITGVNRLSVSDKSMHVSGGTGGYLLWSNLAVPLQANLDRPASKTEFGLNEEGLEDLEFVQVKYFPGDDASCLNLNNVATPPLLGLDPEPFIEKGSFSFASVLRNTKFDNPWSLIEIPSEDNTIYGIADQTVLQWGLKIRTGDTLIVRSESGIPLRIVIAGGLKSSVFQGNIIIGFENFNKHFPSVSGSQILLAYGDPDKAGFYKEILDDRFSGYGIFTESTGARLSSFFKVTNTYLTVFSILGGIGIILGVAGLGFILIKNYNQRKRDFAFLLASGFTVGKIRKLMAGEQIYILISGIAAGLLSSLAATLPSLKTTEGIPWTILAVNVLLIYAIGRLSLLIATRTINHGALIKILRKE